MPTSETPEASPTNGLSSRPAPPAQLPDDDACVKIAGRTYATMNGLAQMLGVTPRTLSRWDERRIGPPKIKIGKMVLFEIEKIPAWLETHEREAVAVRSTSHRRRAA